MWVIPSSGSTSPDTPKTFTSTYSDPDGWANLKEAYFLVSTSSTGLTNSAYLYYDQNANKLYLKDDANTAWLGGYAPGSSYVIENSQVKLNCGSTTISNTTNVLTANWSVTFKPAYSGKACNTYLKVVDDAGSYVGWNWIGTYTVNRSPQVGTITPLSGTGQVNVSQIFTTTYSDPDGWQNIQYAYLLMNTSTSGLNCLYAYHNQNTNKIYLRNDANTSWLGGYTPGSSYVIENSYAKLNCATTTISGSGTTLTVNWSVVIKPPFTGTKNTYLYVTDDANAYNGWLQKGTWTIPNNSPQVGTITPSSGTGQVNVGKIFTATYSDPDGWQNIQYAHLLMNISTSGLNCFYVYYDQNANKLYLRNDANTSWLGGYAPGSSYIIENSYAKLNCASTTVSGTGTTLTVNWSVVIKSPFTGTKNTYLYVTDDANAYNGWTQKGTWTITGTNQPPQVGTITPSSGTSVANALVNFTATYTDANGYSDIRYVYLLVNATSTISNALYVRYDRSLNLLYIMNNDGTAWLGGNSPGSAYGIGNSYASLNCSQTTVSSSGNTLTVNWNVSFNSNFTGTKSTYLDVVDNSSASAGITQKGTWTITPGNQPPQVGTVTPSSGTSSSNQTVTFTTTYTDPNGYQDINYVGFLANTAVAYQNCLLASYDPVANKIYLKNDAGSSDIGGYAPGSSNIIENSYAKLDCFKTTVSGSGNTLTVNWSVAFKSTFTGTKNTYLYAQDKLYYSTNWTQKGTWTIASSNQPPQVGTLTPSSSTSNPNQAVAFTATYSDPDGWQNIQRSYFLISPSINYTNCFYGYYDQNTNQLYLRNDNDTSWIGGYAPGSSYTIENSYVKINCAQTTISGTGNALTVNWSITFKSPFAGTKNTYLYVTDDAGAYNGWGQKGYWTITNQNPSVGMITPSSGISSPNQTVNFTTTYSDPDGWQNITYAYFSVNATASDINCLYAQYNQNTNKLYLRQDAGTILLGGYAPGSSYTIENSYVKINCAQTTVSGSGNTLTVNWSVTFKSPFTGTKNMFLSVMDDAYAFTGPIQKGTIWAQAKMKKIKLENVDIGLEEKLKDKEFKRLYKLECVKVSLAQRIAPVGEILRRHGLYSSELTKIRRDVESGALQELGEEKVLQEARSCLARRIRKDKNRAIG